MAPAGNDLVAQLPAVAYAFALVLARAAGCVMLMPGLGEPDAPMMLRAALALSLAVLLAPALQPMMPPPPAAPLMAAAAVAAEVLAGLFLGWLAQLVALALAASGQVISYMTGLSNVLAPDRDGGQSAALSRLFALAAPVALLASGLYALPLSALAGSYRAIPAGALLPVHDTVAMAVRAVAFSYALAARLAAPFLLAHVVWQVGIGLLARLAPSLHPHTLALPGQVAGGLALLAALSPLVLAAWLAAARGALVPFGN